MKLIEDDVVISGVGGYFPKSLNIGEFKDNLLNNENLFESRWRDGERGVSNVMGVIPPQHFDNAYFGIHRQQCTFMDPMQRLILERTFEALVDAGVNPGEVRGQRVGVYMASAVGENDNLFMESVISGFGVTGHSRAMMPNRVSYWLNLKGPSLAFDGNWIGGVEVLKAAVNAIRSGECDSAIIGAANLALNSEFQWLYNDMGLLSPDGSTKCFDADAKGYARSDGIVVMYLQRSTDARRCYASVVHVGTCFNGDKNGALLDIDEEGMVSFLEDFYSTTTVDPACVDFVEAYGSANQEVDKIEIAALERVYCKNRTAAPLLVGSVKSNTGHSEAAAALFSIVKVLIAMDAQTIPATLQHRRPHPAIAALASGAVEVVAANRPWSGRYAAVNAVGVSSYYGHVLLRANPKPKPACSDALPRLVLASTRTETGMAAILAAVAAAAAPTVDAEYVGLLHGLFAAPIPGHLYRGYALLGAATPKHESEYHLGNRRQVWFVFSGMGSQWAGMAGDLLALPVFAAAIERCRSVLLPRGIDLLEIITTPDKTVFDNILHSFVGIAAIQIGLTDVLRAVGVRPDGIIGHSVGELGCAYADGCLTAEQMILCAYSRGRASLEADLVGGMMAAVGLGHRQLAARCPPSIEVACHNGPDSSTISGPTADMERFVQELQDQGVFARLVNVSNIAYHSRYIRPAAPALLRYLQEVIPAPAERSAKWISTSNVEEDWDTPLARTSSAEYHTNNLLSAVLFEEGLKHIPKDSVLIEIAPHGLLQAILKRSLKSGCTNVPLTQRGTKSALEFLLASLGKLYLAGLNMDLSALYPKVEYPVSRGTPTLSNLVHWEHSEVWKVGLEDSLKTLTGVRDLQVTLNSEEFRDCVGHQLNGDIYLPCSSYLKIIYNMIADINSGNKDIVFENLHFKQALPIPKLGSVAMHTMFQKGSGDFEFLVGNDIIMTGTMVFPSTTDKFLIDCADIEVGEDNVQLSGCDVYNELHHRGHRFSGLFKSIKTLTICEEGSVGVVQWHNKWDMFLEAMIQQHLLQDGERAQGIFIPKTIEKIIISQNLLPAEKADVSVTFNRFTEIISAKGIQIKGLRATAFPKEERLISFDSVQFVPFTNVVHNSLENGINTALHLTLTNFEDRSATSIMITEVESDNPSLLNNIKNVLNQYTKLNPNVTSAKNAKMVAIQHSYPMLIIHNDVINDAIAKVVETSHSFLLVRTDKNLLAHEHLIEIAQFTVSGVPYSIVRKANLGKVATVAVKGDVLSCKDVTRRALPWVAELEAALAAAKADKRAVFLVASLMPTEGVANFAQELLSLPDMASVRLLFIFDKRHGSSDCDTSGPACQRIFKQNLSLTVLKDGLPGTYLPVPANFQEPRHAGLSVGSNMVIQNNKTVQYLSINLNDETLGEHVNKKIQLGNIDYVGTSGSGERIMGLAQLDRDLCKLNPDPILCWAVPERWSMEDAATVPHAYACAYYMFFIKSKLRPGETVLIHAGCTAIGLAAISVAYFHGCTVYTTVATDWQRAYLKKHFGFLNDRNILSSDSVNFQPLLLMATGGEGAHVIVNCLSGNLLQASVDSLATYGRFIQIGKLDMEEDNFIGMNVFLKNASFCTVVLENIITIPNKVKEELRDLVQAGINDVAVRPIKRKTVEHQDIDLILRDLSNVSNIGKIVTKLGSHTELSKFLLDKPHRFICDPKSSYLVHGGTAELWTNMAEWLILRGARKIMVSSEHKPQQPYINRRLSLLQHYYGADIIFTASKVGTREAAAELLSEVYFLGAIHGVFLLPGGRGAAGVRGSETRPVQFIDHALRTTAPKALFVSFISAAAGICEQRANAGYPTLNVQWQSDLEFDVALFGLDSILNFRLKDIFIKNDKISDAQQETTQALFKKLSLLLPPSIEAFGAAVAAAPRTPTLIQLPTKGPRAIRELAPVFIVPGIAGQKEVEELAYNLLYPTYCAVLPSTPLSLHDMAAELVNEMRALWPRGPYNIVAVSWGGGLAVEAARLLGGGGASLHLYFVDSAPHTLQATLRHLGDDAATAEVNLLSRTLNINDPDLLRQIAASPTWGARVQRALDARGVPADNRPMVEEGLAILKARLQSLLSLQANDQLVSGQIHLIRPHTSSKYDNCGLVSYFKQTPQITLVNGDHLSIINSPVTAEYINEKHYLI